MVYLNTLTKIVQSTIVLLGGIFVITKLSQWVVDLKSRCLFLYGTLIIYLVGVAYITIFSRDVSPTVLIELRIIRGFLHGSDLIFKIIKCGVEFITKGVWNGVPRPDINIPYIEEGILNILLFVPLGYIFSIINSCKKKYCVLRCVYIGFLTSLMIEILQLLTEKGTFDLDDLLNNSLGVWIGAWLFAKYTNFRNTSYKGKEQI